MNARRTRLPRFFRGLALTSLGVALTLAGCTDNDPVSPGDDEPIQDTTAPSTLVQSYAEALETMDLDRYAALLEAPAGRSQGFQFIPLAAVADDLPWIPSSGWNYDMEVGMVGHMMDADFASPEIGVSVHHMVIECAITNERSLGDDGIEVACSADIQIFWAVDNSTEFRTGFVMALFPDGDGFLRIRTIQELPHSSGRSDPNPTPPTWGLVKSLFRTPSLRDLVVPSELIAAHADALETNNLGRYAALLETPGGDTDGFRFIPRADDALDLPWIPETGWDSVVELGIIGHMMDPGFISPQTGGSVIDLRMDLSVESVRTIDGGGTEVVCFADILVLWAEYAGARVDSRLLFTLFPDSQGFLRIRSIEELTAFGPRVEEASWAIVKGLYQ